MIKWLTKTKQIQVDKSHSGRLVKGTLRKFGISGKDFLKQLHDEAMDGVAGGDGKVSGKKDRKGKEKSKNSNSKNAKSAAENNKQVIQLLTPQQREEFMVICDEVAVAIATASKNPDTLWSHVPLFRTWSKLK